MAPEEKAKELFNKFPKEIKNANNQNTVYSIKIKNSAMECVKVIIAEMMSNRLLTEYQMEYWEEVLYHLEKL